MRCVLDFIYTGKIALQWSNVFSIRNMADQLNIKLLVELCDEFLEKHMPGKVDKNAVRLEKAADCGLLGLPEEIITEADSLETDMTVVQADPDSPMGVAAAHAHPDSLTGVTATNADSDSHTGVAATHAHLDSLTGVTATHAHLDSLTGVAATHAHPDSPTGVAATHTDSDSYTRVVTIHAEPDSHKVPLRCPFQGIVKRARCYQTARNRQGASTSQTRRKAAMANRAAATHADPDSYATVAATHADPDSYTTVAATHADPDSFTTVAGTHVEPERFTGVAAAHADSDSYTGVAVTHAHPNSDTGVAATHAEPNNHKAPLHHSSLGSLKRARRLQTAKSCRGANTSQPRQKEATANSIATIYPDSITGVAATHAHPDSHKVPLRCSSVGDVKRAQCFQAAQSCRGASTSQARQKTAMANGAAYLTHADPNSHPGAAATHAHPNRHKAPPCHSSGGIVKRVKPLQTTQSQRRNISQPMLKAASANRAACRGGRAWKKAGVTAAVEVQAMNSATLDHNYYISVPVEWTPVREELECDSGTTEEEEKEIKEEAEDRAGGKVRGDEEEEEMEGGGEGEEEEVMSRDANEDAEKEEQAGEKGLKIRYSGHGDNKARDSGHGDKEVRDSGHGDKEARDSGHGDKEARDSGHDDNEARDSGHDDNEARDCGHGDKEARDSGHDDNEARDSGHDDKEARDSGHGDKEARDSGHGDKEARDSGHDDKEARDSGHGDKEARDSGHGDKEARDSGHGDNKARNSDHDDKEASDSGHEETSGDEEVFGLKVEQQLTCEWCHEVSGNMDSLYGHVTQCHPESMHQCQHCQRKFATLSSFEKHVDMCAIGQQVNGRFKCPVCSYDAADLNSVLRHYRLEHKQKRKNTCETCERSFPRRAFYLEHLLKKHDIDVSSFRPVFTCWKCSFKTTWLHSLRNHQQTHNPERSACPLCNKVLNSPKVLKIHMDRQHGRGKITYNCHLCSFHTRYKFSLMRHKYRDHGLLPTPDYQLHPCSQCSRTFLRPGDLAAHIISVHNKGKHTCSYCGMPFHLKSSLAIHERSHVGERPYTCSHCRYSSNSKASLTVHMHRKHAGLASYDCQHCGRTFKCKETFQEHQVGCALQRQWRSIISTRGVPYRTGKRSGPARSSTRETKCPGWHGNYSSQRTEVVNFIPNSQNRTDGGVGGSKLLTSL